MEDESSSLDVEYKRYLQILRPYLGQLLDHDAIDICDAWIQRLSNCSEKEKPVRNRYIFILCYQLSKGILDQPFLKFPPVEELPTISEGNDSDTSTEVEYVVVDGDDPKTKILYKKPNNSETEYLSQSNEFDKIDSCIDFEKKNKKLDENDSMAKRDTICYPCNELMKNCAKDVKDHQYEYRATNLIMRLREIKKQNLLLNNELIALKEESKVKPEEVAESLAKVDHTTSTFKSDTSTALACFKTKLEELQGDRKNLLDALNALQEQVEIMNEKKKMETEEMYANHKLDIFKAKNEVREENKQMYSKKLEELKSYHEDQITNTKESFKDELIQCKLSYEQDVKRKQQIIEQLEKTLNDKEEQLKTKDSIILEKDKELQDKYREIKETDKTLNDKLNEIATLKMQIEDQTHNLHSIISKFIEKPNENVNSEDWKSKTLELEKKLQKMEKSKAKFLKAYETKIAHMQREKHLAECSLQLQLVRQRAQIASEIADENHVELNDAVENLEGRYKEIVANVQAMALQRRMQDQMALDAMFQAIGCIRNDISANHSQFSAKNIGGIRHKDDTQNFEQYDAEITGSINHKRESKILHPTDSVTIGYCLDSERFGELFEKVYVPQRDINDFKK